MDRTVLHLTSELVEFGALALMAILVAITICVGILFKQLARRGQRRSLGPRMTCRREAASMRPRPEVFFFFAPRFHFGPGRQNLAHHRTTDAR